MIYVNNLATCYFEMAKSGKVDNYDQCREYALKAVDVGRENRADYKTIAKALKRVAMCYEKEKNFDDGNYKKYRVLVISIFSHQVVQQISLRAPRKGHSPDRSKGKSYIFLLSTI